MNPNNTEDQTNRDSLDELKKKLMVLYRDCHEYPSLVANVWPDEFVEKALVLIKQHDEEVARTARELFHNSYSGKPEKHPVPCNDCRSDYWVDYVLPHPVFNAVCPGGEGYLCLPCFTKRMTGAQENA